MNEITQLVVDQIGFEVYQLSESALTLEFGNKIDVEISRTISNLNQAIQAQPFIGYRTTVQAYCTLTVFYDPILVLTSKLNGNNCVEKIVGYLKLLSTKITSTTKLITTTITIPVCYGGDFGPDLEEMATLNQLTTNEFIALHSAAKYKVYMIGFVPGFAYLGGLNEKLFSPRKAQPRSTIVSGSVGIAGRQTGIYPLNTPGGWQIIGRTPNKLFDSKCIQPSLLKAGDSVIFKPITIDDFNSYPKHSDAD
ncbi:5-oxoprolinase subunit PxpB [Pedobacter frigidisoli]|uniref:5-oxoprolinase subunit PxpB n=1 Tax=Pedobacter frigidisoli TaxID=2530455 RepID=A0A4R0P249_9SPHI|nr:5-oxoprolinase subunit PxpB [Pedobacter frigidisoli]TCD05605.1 5-oxoprolinase subunit PxpB [Pedobacter frigidisoli]